VIVVPRSERSVHEYLSRSLAGVPGVHVILDRRQGPPHDGENPGGEPSGARSAERRRREASARDILCCVLVTCAERLRGAEVAGLEPEGGQRPHHTLLWPALRLTDL
jgi:hypothetical protein